VKYKNLIFDLDGTLIDPIVGVYASLESSFHISSAKLPAVNELQWIVGPPIKESIEKLLLEQGKVEQLETTHKAFRQAYDSNGFMQYSAYKGAQELINDLKKHYQLFIASSKPQPGPSKIIKCLDLEDHFTGVYGALLDEKIKTKTDVLNLLFSKNNIATSETLMIGDRYHDLEGAKNCNISAIGVTWGYGSRKELSAYPHLNIFDQISELRDFLL